jgi:HPr kinase/phosphorylase
MEVSKAIKENEQTSVQSSVSGHMIAGTLLRVYDRGVLIRGESGTGKSDLALELIARGHKLVADDAVNISFIGSMLIGEAPSMLVGYLEVRGLGVLDIRLLYGPDSLVPVSTIDICIDLKSDRTIDEHDRLGGKGNFLELFGLRCPLHEVHDSANRPLATVVETAVRLLCSGAAESENCLIKKYNAAVAV